MEKTGWEGGRHDGGCEGQNAGCCTWPSNIFCQRKHNWGPVKLKVDALMHDVVQLVLVAIGRRLYIEGKTPVSGSIRAGAS